MAKNPKQTGKRAASAASKVLRSGSTGATNKRAAGSALAQAPFKKRKQVVNPVFVIQHHFDAFIRSGAKGGAILGQGY